MRNRSNIKKDNPKTSSSCSFKEKENKKKRGGREGGRDGK